MSAAAKQRETQDLQMDDADDEQFETTFTPIQKLEVFVFVIGFVPFSKSICIFSRVVAF